MVRLQSDRICKDHKGQQQTIHTVTHWERQMSEMRKNIKLDEYSMKSSALTMFIITVTWVLGALQSVFVWGLAIPFGFVWFLQGFIHFALFVLRNHISQLQSILPNV